MRWRAELSAALAEAAVTAEAAASRLGSGVGPGGNRATAWSHPTLRKVSASARILELLAKNWMQQKEYNA
jgi:hypothetical protein